MPPDDGNGRSPIDKALDDALEGLNAGYVASVYEQYRSDPTSVETEWRRLFDAGLGGFEPIRPPEPIRPSEPASAPPTVEEPPPGATALRGPSARLAANMAASLAVPTATSFRDIPTAVLEARRRQLNELVAPRKVSFTHLVGYAIVRAALEQPGMTRAFADVGGKPHVIDPGSVNLGLAVDVERPDGSRFLVVPVIRDAQDQDFAAFHARYEELVAGARDGSLGPDDYAGATITLTNPGTLGTTASLPRLMVGQGCIIATGAIRDAGSTRVMTITSTYDHRVIQGAESGAFLRRVADLVGGADGFYDVVATSLGVGPLSELPHATLVDRAPSNAVDSATPAKPVVTGSPGPAVPVSGGDLARMASAMALIDAHRLYGHLAAHLDPLGTDPLGDPALDPAFHGLDPAAAGRIRADLLNVHVGGETLAEVLESLRRTYSGTIAYEVEHIANHAERTWLREAIESGRYRSRLKRKERKRLLARLTAVEGLEHFLHKAYLGQKRFSIEGLDTMVPMLDLVLELAAEQGTRRAVIGMAHRGRLNVLTHIVGLPLQSVLAEFEAGRGAQRAKSEGREIDDVKYHLGAGGTHETRHGTVDVNLMPNPSHLEAVGPVVEGRARGEQADHRGPVVRLDNSRTVPLLIHGDAAFAAQGVVAETFNLSRLVGYANGGTVHLIANNQIGFTTAVGEARSTTWASDLAKGFDVPIIHVNADDPEACLDAVRLAMAYRAEFNADVVIDLVGYRRYGHNEADEPSYTQPGMYERIGRQPSVRTQYAERLVAARVLSAKQAAAMADDVRRELVAAQAAVRKAHAEPPLDRGEDALTIEHPAEPTTAVGMDALLALNADVHSTPREFTVHPKLVRQIGRRRDALGSDDPGIEWGHAEALAFATLLRDGVPIRLSGQDTVRGTFGQRHAVLVDAANDTTWSPMQHLAEARASFEVLNSPLSEYACLAFEYGYAVTVPEALVLWEAQYGDFVNGAEIVVDQFIIAGLAKWRQTSRLTLLLPHGYEGQGPEHSSARLERFLALGAEGNIRVAYPTTAAQYFHLLRRQGLHEELRPLVVMTPKSLLRLPEAASRPSELASGGWAPVVDDPERQTDAAAAAVRRVILCSGKIYYDLLLSEARTTAADVALIRVEQLYPFPSETLAGVLARYSRVRQVSWVQEEPRNMGARKFVLPKIRSIVAAKIPLGDVSRPERSRPAEGYPAAHAAEQARIVRDAFA
ncbi:MAG TPA: multifunctional oxoglutarate decarboxylase/oxoglutarate dehydrogenase thiamine pyrophosphate-binding subunit/dihydrolipoyllysine-residue succinyltransferase subunit [Candidatus Limnocylindria bacterium]|nr:multifunctional oxoglutarate decarboxylase/oxoglutarate dehydrogenase thiamine pyrophosphate-binding subunit/dihydrolipoyllysine-residue succinyltransferase subunit [Candidatus Limnocylindria bacterium]